MWWLFFLKSINLFSCFQFEIVYTIIGEGNGNPLQYSCLENSVDRGAWWAAVHGVAQSWTRLKWLSSSSIPLLLYFHDKVFLSFLFCCGGFPGGTSGKGLPCSSKGKESACNAGDQGSIPWSGRSSGEGNGNPLQCSYLENPMNRGVWQATVHRVAKSWTRLSNCTHKHVCTHTNS